MRVLIAGCGYVGCALGERLARDGYSVFGVRRNSAALPASIHAIAADLSDSNSLRNLPGPFDLIFYTAGSSGHTDEAYRAAYVDGLRNTLEAIDAQADPPKRVIFTSSTAVYAQNDGGWVDEESPTDPDSFSGRRMLEAEGLLRTSGFETIALRLGGIYGPGRTGLIDRVRRGDARRENDRVRYINLIHLDDIVGALVHLTTLERPAPVYVGVDDEPQEYNALVEWLAQKIGVPSPPFSDEPQTRGRRAHNRRCSNRRLQKGGYTFQFPSALEGYAGLL